jgi:hypothetical protein
VLYLSPEEERKDNVRKRKERLRATRVKDRAVDAGAWWLVRGGCSLWWWALSPNTADLLRGAARDEASELQAVGVPDHDPNPAKHFTPLPTEVYKSYRQLEEIARLYMLA